MVRTQIQLPDELYERAKRVAAEREMPLAELVRRGLETILSQYPAKTPAAWRLPAVDAGQALVALEDLRRHVVDDLEAGFVGEDE